jgi:hypothetical protein
VVNSTNPKVRQRFTIGHELGHLTLHHGHNLILERLVRLNFRDATSSTASDQEEIEANQFAAELLMPRDLLRHSLTVLLQGRPISDLEVVRRLAKRFEVSQSAMEYRLTSLGMLTPALRTRRLVTMPGIALGHAALTRPGTAFQVWGQVLTRGSTMIMLLRANPFADGSWFVPGSSLEGDKTLPAAAARGPRTASSAWTTVNAEPHKCSEVAQILLGSPLLPLQFSAAVAVFL